MDCTHGSFPPSSSFTPPSSSGEIALESTLAYSNSFSTTAACPGSTELMDAGLGISSCEMEPCGDQPRHYLPSEHYAIPAVNWPSQLMVSTMALEPSLDTSHFSPAPGYEAYPGSDISASPLSYCDLHTTSVSPSHGSAMDFGAAQDIFNEHSPNFWPNTPCSDAGTRVKEDPDTDYQTQTFMDNVNTTAVSIFTPGAHLRANTVSPKVEENGLDVLPQLDLSEERNLDRGLLVDRSVFPVEVISKWIRENASPPNYDKPKLPSASGLQCTTCGAYFTRRSNCREHMKRHDPNSRKSYPCELCGKPFGRKTDLNRHVDSVHRGLRRFGCEQCGYHFSRQDTLARHIADGCKRKVRKSPRKASQPILGARTEDLPKQVCIDQTFQNPQNVNQQ